jgi:hypothetical protein
MGESHPGTRREGLRGDERREHEQGDEDGGDLAAHGIT